jgi:hypothetical protein
LWPRIVTTEGDSIIWRKHLFILVERVWLALLLVLVTLGMTIFTLVNELWIMALIFGIATLGALAWYIYRYDDWHRDVYIVTDDRIIDVRSSPFRLYGEKRIEGPFDVIQNITYSIPGFFSGLLNMGTVSPRLQPERHSAGNLQPDGGLPGKTPPARALARRYQDGRVVRRILQPAWRAASRRRAHDRRPVVSPFP